MLEFNHLLKNYQEGKTLPQDFYTDSNIFSEEMKRIYFKQWLMVDHISRIPNPGDYFVFDAEKESIIVIRGRDNDVRAFYNVCTHRGSRICLDEEGSKKLLVCPYHAWSFSAEGELKAARFMPEDFKKEEALAIPKKTNFNKVGSLSNEIIEKLSKTRPPTLGAASRISGVTPAAIIAIMRYLKKQKNKKVA